MKFILFQEQLKSEISEDINNLGWDGAIKKYPDLKIIMATQFSGDESFDSENPEEFKQVFDEYYMASAEVDGEFIHDVFHWSNTCDSRVTKLHKKYRSASVGDVIYDVTNDEYHMINPIGLELIKL